MCLDGAGGSPGFKGLAIHTADIWIQRGELCTGYPHAITLQ
jgi:hypothetical protein